MCSVCVCVCVPRLCSNCLLLARYNTHSHTHLGAYVGLFGFGCSGARRLVLAHSSKASFLSQVASLYPFWCPYCWVSLPHLLKGKDRRRWHPFSERVCWGGGLSFELTYRFMKNSWSCLKSVFYYLLHLEAAESCLREQIYYCSLNQHCILNPWKSLPLQPARWDEEQAGVCWGANVAFKCTFTCFSACWSSYTDPNPHLTSSRFCGSHKHKFKILYLSSGECQKWQHS